MAQFLAVVLPILILTKLAGDDFGSIFLKRGNIRAGPIFGVVSFGAFAVLALVLSSRSELSRDEILSAVPGELVFVFANSFMEELWFRGIFLNNFKPFLGVVLSVSVTSIVFGVAYLGSTYVSAAEIIGFLAVVLTLGFVTGYVMLKTDSIWGSVLFHAGADLVIIIPVLDSLS